MCIEFHSIKKDAKLVESIQRKLTKMVEDLEDKVYEELFEVPWFAQRSPEKWRLRGRPHRGLKLLSGSGGAALSSAFW